MQALNAILMGIVINDRVPITKIVPRWRRGNAPLEGCAVPRISGGGFASETAMNKVVEENKLSGTGDQRGDGDEAVHGHQRGHEVVDKGCKAADVTDQTEIMEGHKNAVGAYKGEPEVHSAERLIHHAAEHLGKPEVGAGQNAEDGRYSHDHVEMAYDEVSSVEIDVNGRLREEKAADPATNEHGDETERE